MISKIQSYNDNVNFQSRIHMDWQTARFLELKGKEESVTGEFRNQLRNLKNNKEHDVVFLKSVNDLDNDRFTLEIVTKDGRHGESVVDNYNNKAMRKKIDLNEMYKEAKAGLKDRFGKLGFEALNI